MSRRSHRIPSGPQEPYWGPCEPWGSLGALGASGAV